LTKTRTPILILKFDHNAVGIAARIGSVIVSAIIIESPIEELQMAVAADRVLIKKICRAKLANPNFQTALGQFCKERKRSSYRLIVFFAQGNDLTHEHSGDIRL